MRRRKPPWSALLQCVWQRARARGFGALSKDRHDPVLRRRRLDRAGRAARPRDALAGPDRILRGRQAHRRATRRDTREVRGRCGDGGLRPHATARRRRIARSSNRSRDANDAGAAERAFPAALRRRPRDADWDQHGYGLGKGPRSRSQLRGRGRGEYRGTSAASSRAGRDHPLGVGVQARPRVGRGRARRPPRA